jgi:hypothetical protein
LRAKLAVLENDALEIVPMTLLAVTKEAVAAELAEIAFEELTETEAVIEYEPVSNCGRIVPAVILLAVKKKFG